MYRSEDRLSANGLWQVYSRRMLRLLENPGPIWTKPKHQPISNWRKLRYELQYVYGCLQHKLKHLIRCDCDE